MFEAIFHKFRRDLEKHGEGDRWRSYGLSYEALLSCARLGRHGQMAYVYKACVNAHKRFHKLLIEQEGPSHTSDNLAWVSARPGMTETLTDFMLDLDEVLERFPGIDAKVCRMRLLEGLTFQEIGGALGIDASTAFRRFNRRSSAIESVLGAYLDRPFTPIVGPFVAKADAA